MAACFALRVSRLVRLVGTARVGGVRASGLPAALVGGDAGDAVDVAADGVDGGVAVASAAGGAGVDGLVC